MCVCVCVSVCAFACVCVCAAQHRQCEWASQCIDNIQLPIHKCIKRTFTYCGTKTTNTQTQSFNLKKPIKGQQSIQQQLYTAYIII